MKDLTQTQKDALMHRMFFNTVAMRQLVTDMVMVRRMRGEDATRINPAELAMLELWTHGKRTIKETEDMVLANVDEDGWLDIIVGAYRDHKARAQGATGGMNIESLPMLSDYDQDERVTELAKEVFGK